MDYLEAEDKAIKVFTNLPHSLLPEGEIVVALPSGKIVNLPVCYPEFSLWKGLDVDFDYGGKPLINFQGEAVFAELAILRILLGAGWNGVWVETYGGRNFLREMPHGWKLSPYNVAIPNEKSQIVTQIQKVGKTTACFDVFAWYENEILFCEAKNKGKDVLTKAQLKFIEGALSYGLQPKSLLIAEWSPV